MQSQQKKVKWSRGETADALEERTDTGITQVSVSKLENIIADIYGNISRRPAFRMIPYANGVTDNSTITASTRAKLVPFKISRDDVVFFVFPNQNATTQWFSYYRVKDGKIVYVGNQQYNEVPITIPTGYAQYNNFMILSCAAGNVKIQASNITEDEITFTFEKFVYSGAWYSDSTIEYPVSSETLPGLSINVNQDGYVQIQVSSNNGIENNLYSAVTTGLKNTATNMARLAEAIPVGSIITFPNMGGRLRVEGICLYSGNGVLFPTYIFDGVRLDSAPSNGTYCVVDTRSAHIAHVDVKVVVNGKTVKTTRTLFTGFIVQCRASSTGFSIGSINGWKDYPAGNLYLYLYGEQLSPLTNKNGVDTKITVLAGYEELNSDNSIFRTITFSGQRLYAGGWTSTDLMTEHGALVIASQIAKYNDFKNNYDTANEAITLDISTKAKEQVLHIVDYNGLQILTDVAEYSYQPGGAVIKQSDNGTLKDCMPLVFNNTLLYADRSEKNILVAQYNFQTNVFGSTKINSFAREDLIWHPISLSYYEEKEHTSGTFLFVINDPADKLHDKAELAVCNLIPQNQEVIWTRWDSVSFPYTYTTTDTTTVTARYAWRNQSTGVTTYTEFAEPAAGATLYDANGDTETQFEQNTVYSTDAGSIVVLAQENQTTETFYAWEADGITYYTTSATPSADDPIYMKNPDGTFTALDESVPWYKVWATGTNTITVQPQMDYWEGNYTGGIPYYNKYWSTNNDPQVGDTVYGYYIWANTHDFRYPEPFTVTDRNGSTLTLERINVDTYETITILATRISGPQDKAAVVANRDSASDETATLTTPVYDTLQRFEGGDITQTETTTTTHSGETSIIKDTVQVDNKVYFLCGFDRTFRMAELDYNALLDFNTLVVNNKYTPSGLILEGAKVQIYDGTEYKFDATVGADGTLTPTTSGLQHPHAGFWINATLESHPIDVGGRTYTDHKRIGKAVAVIRDTEPNAFTVCDRTGYTSTDKKKVNFYGCTGMKDQIRYTIKNIQGAKFTIESLTMIIEYATLDS